MNKKQLKIFLIADTIIVASIVVWIVYGMEIFTKNQVLIEKKDELFGWTEKVWVDKFIWGLDLSLAIIGITLAVGGFLFYKFRNKKEHLVN